MRWPWQRVPLEGLSTKDRVVLVIGPTGVGKSRFINTAANKDFLQVGHGLSECTKEIAHVRYIPPNGGQQIVFVDTPPLPDIEDIGNDDGKMVESKIKDWLKQTFGKRIRVTAILYLYRITDKRMTNPPLPHYNMFRKLCGKDFKARALLVTTMWEQLRDQETGAKRLCTLAGHWRTTEGKSAVVVHNGTNKSAWDILVKLVGDGELLDGSGP